MTLLAALLIALGLFLISATLILLLVGPTLLLHPRRRTAEFYRRLGRPVTPSEAGLQFESISVPVEEGIALSSWLIRAAVPPKGTLIYLHGVADCKIDGIRFAKLMHARGYNVFLFDARRHGESGGKFCTYGYYEKYDVLRIIDFLLSRNGLAAGRIGLFGTSMGAAVALQAASIDPRIAAVAAENSFATLRTIFDDYQKRMIMLPFHYLRNMVIVRSEFAAHFKASDVSPLDAVRKIHIPVLIIYGRDDPRISHHYSLQLFEQANEPKEMLPIEGAAHTDLWDVGGAVYEETLIRFFGTRL